MRGIKRFLLAMTAIASLLIGGCGSDNDILVFPTYSVGVVSFSNGWIGMIDGSTQTVSAPFLVGEIGSAGGQSLDVVVTPDRKKALISNFGDSTVHIIDISRPSAPGVVGSVTLSFLAEDIALTPNGRYALVTDGGFSPKIAVIDVETGVLAEEYTDAGGNSFQAVAVAADGQTVLTIDYFSGAANTLTIDAAGHLTFVGSIDISNGGTFHPVNVSISPDGKTAIVAGPASATDPVRPADNMRFPVLGITAPGVVELRSFVVTAARINASQSIVFNAAGTKAYALCVQEDPDLTDLIVPTNTIVELNVVGPGAVSDSGFTVDVDFVGTSQLFGVDTLAMDHAGYLYVSNQTVSGAKAHLQIVNVNTHAVVKTIDFADVEVPPASGIFEPALPTGLFIR